MNEILSKLIEYMSLKCIFWRCRNLWHFPLQIVTPSQIATITNCYVTAVQSESQRYAELFYTASHITYTGFNRAFLVLCVSFFGGCTWRSFYIPQGWFASASVIVKDTDHTGSSRTSGALLLTWYNFNPSMNKQSVQWIYLSISKLQQCRNWSLGSNK